MKKIIAVRVYFEYGSSAKKRTLKQRLLYPRLGSHILKLAKEEGIEQAICFRVTSGYLKHQQKIHWGHHEVMVSQHPQCIELIDEQDKLELFTSKYNHLLQENNVLVVKQEITRMAELA